MVFHMEHAERELLSFLFHGLMWAAMGSLCKVQLLIQYFTKLQQQVEASNCEHFQRALTSKSPFRNYNHLHKGRQRHTQWLNEKWITRNTPWNETISKLPHIDHTSSSRHIICVKRHNKLRIPSSTEPQLTEPQTAKLHSTRQSLIKEWY